jgi:transposase
MFGSGTMRNEAPVIVLAEWAARTNAESREAMGVSVGPEIPERRYARAYLADLMSDTEAAACVADDLARVWALCGHPDEDDDGWDREAWASAAREYRKDRGNRPSLVEYKAADLARLRSLLINKRSLDHVKAEIQAHHERQRNAAASTIDALTFDLRERGTEALADPKQGRIFQLGDEQITEVAARLRQLKPHIAKAWTADEAQQLISKWGALHRE